MNERIKEIRTTYNLTQQEFADRIGIKRNTISAYESGRNRPVDAVISLICREFGINEEWLRNGTGEMFIPKTKEEEIAAFLGRIQASPPDSFQKQLFSVLAKLSEEQWALLADMANIMTEEKD